VFGEKYCWAQGEDSIEWRNHEEQMSAMWRLESSWGIWDCELARGEDEELELKKGVHLGWNRGPRAELRFKAEIGVHAVQEWFDRFRIKVEIVAIEIRVKVEIVGIWWLECLSD